MLGFRVGGNANFKIRVGANANISVFRYQHVGIGEAKISHWGDYPTPGPNASSFASQWNIGLSRIIAKKLCATVRPFRVEVDNPSS